jgi:hypothetical protein
MLDLYLETAHDHELEKQAQADMIEGFKKLPVYELLKIAQGEGEKVGFYQEGDDWLSKFKGTPFFEKAVQLEQSAIQNQMAEQQARESNRDSTEQFFNERDRLCLQKRLLTLQLAQQEEQGGMGMSGEVPPEAGPALDQSAPPTPPAEPTPSPQSTSVQVEKSAGRSRVAPQSKNETIGAEENNQGAGQLGAFNPTTEDHYENTTSKDAAAKIASADALARELARADFKKLSMPMPPPPSAMSATGAPAPKMAPAAASATLNPMAAKVQSPPTAGAMGGLLPTKTAATKEAFNPVQAIHGLKAVARGTKDAVRKGGGLGEKAGREAGGKKLKTLGGQFLKKYPGETAAGALALGTGAGLAAS